ncbi:hypothetical protein SUGI_0175610 [Cryptomeria japonica]|uniref:probable LRR receptor-like serine/threonine-protein kinase At1g67720 n=1 Tax=Cryptomeria japonica TaxID=3369 RepID=UPI002408C23D|nr:probable LRR receptor-like serine/threonine-protein kinase At1g67720 [Cryptomeria japonica]GLJ11732.1 hypothetical protein SUGI_0175610 [Cryptomeria japonica]
MLPAWMLLVFSLILNVEADQPGFISINCGATNGYVDLTTGLNWVPDDAFINVGNQTTLQRAVLQTVLKTLRVFPDRNAKKYCYELPVLRNRGYLVRTTYYYGNFDGRNAPPVFEQLIEGTMWTTVNTTMDYSKGLYTYYEVVIASTGKSMSVCLARNGNTIGDPFISAIELRLLESSMYNSTDFTKYALALLSRHNFGNSANNVIRYPDDPYDRMWQPFQDSHSNVSRNLNTTTRGLWNIPPPKIFETALATDKLEPMEIQWPDQNLPNNSYYIALYFLNLDIAEPQRLRAFNISVNGINFVSEFNVSIIPRMVYARNWTLSGPTSLLLTPVSQSSLGPIINAGELFELVNLGGRTITRDVIALNLVKKDLINVPSDWHGDPCLPVGYSWTGISCSEGSPIRVQILNLTSAGLSGSLSPRIADLTALTHIWLGNNNLSGPIPDLVSLKLLTSLHLEGNKFSGNIPNSLAQLSNLSELFLQLNDLSGQVPNGLSNNTKLNLVIHPGNPLLVN